jgi:hypothetical protein
MAKDQTKRLSPKDLSGDTITNDALKGVAGYAPVNPQFSVANLKALFDTMTAAQAAETQAEAALRTSRDKAVVAEWNFHNSILGAKDQVKAQFGKDSNELQALGLKKASEYKRHTVKKKQ